AGRHKSGSVSSSVRADRSAETVRANVSGSVRLWRELNPAPTKPAARRKETRVSERENVPITHQVIVQLDAYQRGDDVSLPVGTIIELLKVGEAAKWKLAYKTMKAPTPQPITSDWLREQGWEDDREAGWVLDINDGSWLFIPNVLGDTLQVYLDHEWMDC